MPGTQHRFHDPSKGAALAVRVVTRASKNELAEILPDGTLKVKLTAAPVDGQANQALLKFFSDILDVGITSIEIIAGRNSKTKLIAVDGIRAEELDKKILSIMRGR